MEKIRNFDFGSLFGLAKTPEQRNREWRLRLKSMQRQLDVQIRDIERTRKQTEREIKRCASRNDVRSARALAKEIVSARRAISELYVSKARMASVERALTRQSATSKSIDVIKTSSEVLKAMNDLVRTSAVREDAREMGREMCRAGIIEELVEDAMDDLVSDDEEETENAIEDILKEITGEVVLPDAGKETEKNEVMAKETSEASLPGETTTADLKARLDAMREEAA